MSDDAGAEASGSIARSRSRRTQATKSARESVLEKYKAARSGQIKNKFEVDEIQNVYDVVEESVYSKRVQDRQKDDWIVDDGNGAYFEDGREIFDDDLIDDDEEDRSRTRKRGKSKKEKESEKLQKELHKSGFQDLRNMLSSMPAKRKHPDSDGQSSSKVNEDELLGSLLKELHEDKKPKIAPSRLQAFQEDMKFKITSNRIREDKKPIITYNFLKELRDDKSPSPTPIPIDDYESNEIPMEDEPIHNTGSENTPTFFQSKMADADRQLSSSVPEKKPIDKALKEVREDNVAIAIDTSMDTDDSLMLLDDEVDEAMGALMMEDESSDDKKLNFFLLDIHEEPKNPGQLYLFGKVQSSARQYSSCCVIIKNLTRCVYFLPKENDAPDDESNCDAILEEFDNVISPKFHISSFKSRPVHKKYCFDVPNVPKSSAYLEVRYSGSHQSLPSDLKGESFLKVFGTSITLMETFLLEMKLKGPSWLQITKPTEIENGQHQSWCKFEFTCDVKSVKHHPDDANITVPPLILVSLNVLTVHNASAKKDDIVFIGLAVNRKFHLQSSVQTNSGYHESFCLLNKPSGEVWPLDVDKVTNKRVMKMDSERALLGCFLAKLQQIDADIFLGHDLNFELVLLHLLEYKVPHWSRIGRLKRSTHIAKNNKMIDFKAALAGRLLCDVKISAMELIRARSYDLASLATQVLGKKEDEVGIFTGPEMKQLFDTSQGLRCFTNWGMNHCAINLQLVNELQVMPLALQITTIAGNTLSRTLLGGRSERNEFLLLHAFYLKGYIVPDKQIKLPWKKGGIKKHEVDGDEAHDGKTGDAEKKDSESYIGGLVLTPKKGFYDNYIVLMDFNSLYPSIIQEFNVCFTTRTNMDDSEMEEKERGILPEEIRKLVESRKQVKSLMKGEVSTELMKQYDIRQKALKLTANSMYGCLGFRNSRFFAKELAALITGKGREILLKTKDAVEKMGYEVIYGDTDSIMINSNSQDLQTVYQIGNKIKMEINKMYKLLELEIDGIFRFLLLLKKKKYAALIYNAKPNGESETVLELKGLDMVRRDWAPVAGNTARLILNEIMSEQSLDDKVFKICKILNEISENLREGNVALRELLITKQLTKSPNEYKKAQGLHHVQVALKMNENGRLAKKFRNGDTVSYLFCTDGNPHHLSELSASVNHHSASKTEETETPANSEEVQVVLKPDPVYYLAQQIHPVVSRICDPIPGLDPARIAEALGLDSTSYKRRRQIEEDDDKLLGEQTDAEKYRDCERFSFKCGNLECRNEILFEDFLKVDSRDYKLSCPKCSIPQHTQHILNILILFMRKFIARYYKNIYICEDPSCSNTERAVPFRLTRGFPQCACNRGYMFKEYNETQLYKQLTYLQNTFDIEKQKQNARELKKSDDSALMSLEYRETMDALKMEVTKTLLKSGYSEINLGTLFQDLYPSSKVSKQDSSNVDKSSQMHE